jgi:hypothetical protein
MPILTPLAAASLKQWGFLSSAELAATDPYFRYTTLLLHGDGTNGAQNNTFLDSSTNNFTITRNGNTTQGTFSPFSQTGWSNYFDGSGDYIHNTTNYLIASTTTTFTAEAWIYMTAAPTDDANDLPGMLSLNSEGATGSLNYLSFGPISTRALRLRWFDGTSKTATGSTILELNTWYHVSCSVSSNAIKLFVNGVEETLSGTTTLTNRSANENGFALGQTYTYANYSGYISNARVVSGTAVYTSSFTPSTTPLTAISGTVLLTCQSNRFVDNSSNAYAITSGGNTSVQAFSPFAPTAAYSAATVGGSGYFDGSGDYCTFSSNSAMDFGTGAFTIEAWIYTGDKTVSVGASRTIIGNSGNSYTMQLYIDSSVGKVVFGNTGSTNLQGTSNVANNAWNHVVVVRSGTGTNQTAIFVNGSREAVGTNTQNYTSGTIYLGAFDTGNGFWNGYISNFRIVKGTAVYDPTQTTLTVPTTPLTAVSNTALLLNFTNGGIIDNTAKNVLETVGNAQISTSVKKYGTGSLAFDGTGDYLQTKALNENLNLGTGDFTIEGWFYLNTTPSTMGLLQMSSTAGGFAANQSANIGIATASSTTWQIYAKNTFTISSSTTVPVTTWTHFALVRNGTTTVLYIGGSSVITLTSDSTNYNTPYIGIGGIYDSSSYLLNGYIDDFRITKGIARYASNFTPPTAAFADQ